MSFAICANLSGSGTPAPCCPPPPCGLEYRKKESSADLCGFSEFGSPSSPPKKYRTKTIGGNLDFYTGPSSGGCSRTSDGHSWQYAGGMAQYSSATCALTNVLSLTSQDGTVTPDASWVPNCDNSSCVPPTRCSQSITATSYIVNGTGDCVNCRGGGPARDSTEGNNTVSLSDEDTEDDAIDRANALIANWTNCPSGCSGFKAARGSGVFSLGYRAVQIRVVSSNTVLGVTYEATISLSKRVYGGGGSFAPWADIFHQFVGTAGVYVGPWLTLPVESGYEVQADGCVNAIVA